MSLSKRAAFLILPVIVAAYTLAAFQVYLSQSDAITRLEQTRLDNRLIELRSSFESYRSFINGFVLNVANGDKLRNFLQEKNDAYRIISLRNGIDRYVAGFQQQSLGVSSFAVVNPQLEPEYYFEDSTDPFSTISAEQLAFARHLFREKMFIGKAHFKGEQGSRIVQGYILDASTLTRPLHIDGEHSVLLLASIQPLTYDRLLAETAAEYDAAIAYQAAAPATATGLRASVELWPGYFLDVEPNREYLSGLKTNLRLWLVLAVLLLSVSTFGLLMFLIRKFITRPVSELEQQLELVVQNKLENIPKPRQDDEIGRLGTKFHDLYEELSNMLEHTRAMSRTDGLTGLPNRVAFQDIAQYRLAVANKRAGQLCFIYVDLDNFKFVNDKYGHDVGDNLLRSFSGKMLKLLEMHSSASVWMRMFRLSGDEFAIVVDGLGYAEIELFSKEVLMLFNCGFQFDQGNFPVTASLGIANFPSDGDTVSQLISNADLAMYQAKRKGKNRFAFYSRDIAEQARRQVSIEDELNKIDPDEEFYLVYMPIVDRCQRIVSYEVLLRWESPVLGNVSPIEFIPIAESGGQFMKIDYWVIDRAVASLPLLRERAGADTKLSINISSAQLGTEQVKTHITRVLKKYSVSSADIEIEITETYNLEQIENVLDRLNVFRDQAFAVVIDDFGVGNTSLMQLIDCPIDKIKLDKDFVDRVTRTHKQDLIAAFIKLCHTQDIEVTAEGIETEQQCRLLLDAGCDYLQGYYFSKPRRLAETPVVATFVEQHVGVRSLP